MIEKLQQQIEKLNTECERLQTRLDKGIFFNEIGRQNCIQLILENRKELSTLLKTTWQMADYVLENINLEDDDNYELIGELQKIKSLCEQNLPELKQ